MSIRQQQLAIFGALGIVVTMLGCSPLDLERSYFGCESDEDCATGYVCDTASSPARCVEAAGMADAQDDGTEDILEDVMADEDTADADLDMEPDLDLCGGVECGVNETCCNDECVDLSGDQANCGSCGTTCEPGAFCTSGRCLCEDQVCGPDETCCSGTGCQNLSTNRESCGACGSACGVGEVCQDGTCACGGGPACAADQYCCADVCVPNSTSCTCGGTACSSDEFCCDDQCVELATDATNCGTCGNDCAAYPNVESAMCSAGECLSNCRTGFLDCNGNPADGCELEERAENTPATCGDGVDNDCNGATDCEDPGCLLNSPSCAQLIFVTSDQFRGGDINGLGGGHDICNGAASAAGLGNRGPWKAVLSSMSVNAKDMITISKRIVNMNGEMVSGANPSDLWDGSLDNPVGYDENGNMLTTEVWTGTDPNGTLAGAFGACADWTGGLAFVQAVQGRSDAANQRWINDQQRDCDSLAALYCISDQ